MTDVFDPNTWNAFFAERDSELCRIYLDDDGREFVYVDGADYQWATAWRWCARHAPGDKFYARRAVGVNDCGVRLYTYTLYLHVEIMKRTGRRKPSQKHIIVDHKNGNTIDNRRRNLRWATVSMNVLNRGGYSSYELIEDILRSTLEHDHRPSSF